MAFFEWSDEFSVNIKEIDEEHKQLVKMLNDLYEAMKAGQGSEMVGRILTGMAEYAKTHFATEERYMKRYAYPGYAAHKAEHDEFAAKAADLLERYAQNSKVLSIETGSFLKNWLRDHITGTDKLYGPYLNEKGVF